MREQKFDVVTIGEIVIDLLTEEMVGSMEEASRYQRYFGGSPANIGVNLSQLGFASTIIGRVGQDSFGRFAEKFLRGKGVGLTGIQVDEQSPTTAIFVSRTSGTPEVIHYRGADQNLCFTEAGRMLIDQARFVHFSGFALSRSPSRKTLFQFKDYAIRQGKQITFDPCFHAPLWADPSRGKAILEQFIDQMWLVKPSYDDLTRLWGPIAPKKGIARYHQLGAQNVILTLGKDGVLVSDGSQITHVPGEKLTVQDATGAGDSFWSGLYGGLLLGQSLEQAVQVGMKTAAITLQYRGAIAPLPPMREIIQRSRVEEDRA